LSGVHPSSFGVKSGVAGGLPPICNLMESHLKTCSH
jgi:hypothetical protein